MLPKFDRLRAFGNFDAVIQLAHEYPAVELTDNGITRAMLVLPERYDLLNLYEQIYKRDYARKHPGDADS